MSDSLTGSGLDIDDPRNLMFMPTRPGARQMRLRPERLLHDGGHQAYNAHVMLRLQGGANVSELMDELRVQIRRADPDLPWP